MWQRVLWGPRVLVLPVRLGYSEVQCYCGLRGRVRLGIGYKRSQGGVSRHVLPRVGMHRLQPKTVWSSEGQGPEAVHSLSLAPLVIPKSGRIQKA